MLALHAGPAPAPRRQVLVGTALWCAGLATLVGGMLSVWMRLRSHALEVPDGRWVPKGVSIAQVPSNVMLLAFVPACIFGQWAAYSARRDDRPNTGLAIGLTGLMGLAVVNAQVYVWTRMKVPVRGGAYNSMFYALTGTSLVLVIIGVGFSAVTAFRYLGGRSADREIVSAHALYWYFLSGVFFALWLVVYVTK